MVISLDRRIRDWKLVIVTIHCIQKRTVVEKTRWSYYIVGCHLFNKPVSIGITLIFTYITLTYILACVFFCIVDMYAVWLIDRSMDFVIARYNEDPNWLVQDLKKVANNLKISDVRIFVYDKGNDCKLGDCTGFHVQSLPNIGRESHTYLSHIVKYYDAYKNGDPTRIIVFLQGDLTDHIKYRRIPTNVVFLQGMVASAIKTNASSHNCLWTHPFNPNFNTTEYPKGCPLTPAGGTLSEWTEKMGIFTNKKFPNTMKWWQAALFAVQAKCLFRHNVSFYEQLLAQHTTMNSEVPHFMERSWFYIFNDV